MTATEAQEQQAAKVGHRQENKDARINTTDPDSALQKTPGGWAQGFNVQAAANENQVIVAADVTSDKNDVNQLESMITQAQENLEGTDSSIEQVVADAGYYSNDNVELDLGVEILIAPTSSRGLDDALAQRTEPGGNDEQAQRLWKAERALAEQRAAMRPQIMEGYAARYVTTPVILETGPLGKTALDQSMAITESIALSTATPQLSPSP